MRVNGVGLDQPPNGLGEVAALTRVYDCDEKARQLQRRRERGLHTAGGLHDDHLRPQHPESGLQGLDALIVVGLLTTHTARSDGPV